MKGRSWSHFIQRYVRGVLAKSAAAGNTEHDRPKSQLAMEVKSMYMEEHSV
jgi:hypothetical protein